MPVLTADAATLTELLSPERLSVLLGLTSGAGVVIAMQHHGRLKAKRAARRQTR